MEMKRSIILPRTYHNAFLISFSIHLLAAAIFAIFLSQPEYDSEDFILADVIQPVSGKRRRITPRDIRRLNPKEALNARNLPAPNWQHIATTPYKPVPLINVADVPHIEDAIGTDSIGQAYSTRILLTPEVMRNSSPIGKDIKNPYTSPVLRSEIPGAKHRLEIDAGGITQQMAPLALPHTALEKIARRLLAHKRLEKVDVVFVLDVSQSMQDNINAVVSHLSKMTDILQEGGLNFTVGVVTFRHGSVYSLLGWDVNIFPQTTDIGRIKEILRSIRCRGGEKTLDALMQACAQAKFRPDAEKRFILVTDEYVSGSYSGMEVIRQISKLDIKVDVLGVDEPFQKILARRTGGIWQPISSIDSSISP